MAHLGEPAPRRRPRSSFRNRRGPDDGACAALGGAAAARRVAPGPKLACAATHNAGLRPFMLYRGNIHANKQVHDLL